MQLRAKSRLFLLNIVPGVGDYTTLGIIQKLKEDLSFTEEEHKALKFTTKDNMTSWDEKADTPVDILVGEKATDVIKDALRDLDSKKKLLVDFMPLYAHFVLGEEWKEE